ncbi:hypothetical protein CENDO_09290 [Corynebacterium endometrii]|uniref:Uncharacterized protein n=1 Tax=Corynebacterium endometrii TaxID=2488819 RepID=A0A4P7QHC6_9CORY|nr:hypothetical protein CENDO_09290 [Corynebacterium endometrii]
MLILVAAMVINVAPKMVLVWASPPNDSLPVTSTAASAVIVRFSPTAADMQIWVATIGQINPRVLFVELFGDLIKAV